ncbi:MAG: hypothetical protein AB1601_01310 [Planctomycetota bacterium]
MRPLVLVAANLLVLAALPPTRAADPADLAVTRVALFSSGVGYFEREAEIAGSTSAELKFRTEQINDIIKSMVLQDFGGGKIGIISYASRDPIEKTLRSFGVDLTGRPTLFQLLDQLRGEPVEIAGARNLKGVILAVEKKLILGPEGQTTEEKEFVTLHTAEGLQQLALEQIQNLRLMNEKVDQELAKALVTLASAHDADKKTVTIHFDGQGARKVRAAYLLEAPIWKTSYRLVLADDKKPFLQGWATVENATEEDWNNVWLSLVSGRPISFRMDLYTPLYVPRPLEQLELYASLRPPEYDAGFGEAEPPTPPGTHSLMAKGRAAGMSAARRHVESLMTPAAAAPEEARLGIELAGQGIESVATALQAGELFAYHIDTQVSIPRQHSAMLPIVNKAIEGEKVSVFNVTTHAKYPLNGLELKNTSGLNLMQGPVTIFDADIYAGDAKLPDLKPDEKRLIAYALDLSTEVLIEQKPTPEELVSLRIARGTLWQRRKSVDARQYLIKNKADKDRTVLVEQAYGEGWTLVEPKEPYERTQELLRFKVAVPAHKTVTQNVKLERVMDQTVVLSNVGLEQIQFFLRTPVITPAVKSALEKVISLRNELEEVTRRRIRLETQQEESIAEQARVRENLKTLDKSTDAYQRQLKRFDEVDARIMELAKQVAAARDEQEQKQKALDAYLLSLNVE